MHKRFQQIYKLAHLLDNQFNFFGFHFGLSTIIGIIPGFGDTLDALLSLYIIYLAIQLKVPPLRIGQMLTNVGVNFVIGIIPIFGDLIYALRKVNLKNLEIIKQHAPSESSKAHLLA